MKKLIHFGDCMKKIKLIAVVLGAAVLISGCSNFFQGKIAMDNSKRNVTLENLLIAPKKITKLDIPEQIFVSKQMYGGKIAVSWSEVENATSYRLERAVVQSDSEGNFTVPEESDYSTLQKFVVGTIYIDTVIQNPSYSNSEYSNYYFYRVCAENIGKGLSSDFISCTDGENPEGPGTLFAPPMAVEADKGKSTDTINVTWKKTEGAVRYIIYRGENADGTEMEKVGEVLGGKSEYSNGISEANQGKEYYYKVCAQNSYGNVSAFSSIAMGYSLKEGAPAAPSGVSVENALGQSITSVTVKWDEVSGTEKVEISYNLFRNSSEDSSYTLVKKIADSTTTSYTDKSIKPGITYWYYVQTVATPKDGSEDDILKSSFSASGQDSENPARAYLLSAPKNLVVENKDSELVLSWDEALGSSENTYTYNIYSSDELKGTYSLLAESISDVSSVVEKKNFYKVSTVNENGLESALSEAAAPVPDSPSSIKVSRTANLSSVASVAWRANFNGVYPVLIEWEAPVSDKPAGYLIYRSTKVDSGYRKITDSPVTDLSFVDSNETAKAGSIYYYRVVSVNELGQGKNGVTEYGYGAITSEHWFREYNKTILSSQDKLTLMHKPNDLDKIGSETIKGDISGTLSYKAAVAGLGAEITMHYENYSDKYMCDDENLGVYFLCTGNTDTTSNMSGNGYMHGTVTCTGMYPGSAKYDNLDIKGGAAGGGSYIVTTKDLEGNIIIPETNVDWIIGEEK